MIKSASMADVLKELVEHPPERPGDAARAEVRANLELLKRAISAKLSAKTIATALTQKTGKKWTPEKLRRCYKEVTGGQQFGARKSTKK